jgi:Mn2+/Fe2+ NRAMP family transporter
VALIPGIPQIKLLLFTQCVNGLLLPFILITIVSLSNNRAIMGEYKNSTLFNLAAWSITIIISCLSLLLLARTIADNFSG